jgi:hypothetical protein
MTSTAGPPGPAYRNRTQLARAEHLPQDQSATVGGCAGTTPGVPHKSGMTSARRSSSGDSRTHPAGVESRATAGASDSTPAGTERPDKKSPASGLSEFLARVLGQLSLSSWLPSAMLVGNLAVMLEMHARRSADVLAAVKELTDPIGVVVGLLFALILATIIIQAFEFETIRALEGYFEMTRGPLARLARRKIRRHASRRCHTEEQFRAARDDAFMKARRAMLQLPDAYQQKKLDILESQILGLGQPPDVTMAQVQEARKIRWRAHVAAEVLYEVDALAARLRAYPERHRVLPTRLGNVLRAAEDKLQLSPGENLEGFVLRNHDVIPQLLRNNHHDYRTRLEMYTSLLLVFIALAVASPALLADFMKLWAALVALAFLLLAWVSYEAAIASAKGYGLVLLEINRHAMQQRSRGS